MAQLCIYGSTASGRCSATWAFLLGDQAKASCIVECLTGTWTWFLAHFVYKAQQLCSVMIAYTVAGNHHRLCCTGPPFLSPSCGLPHPGVSLHFAAGAAWAGQECPQRCSAKWCYLYTLRWPKPPLTCKGTAWDRPEKGKGCVGDEHGYLLSPVWVPCEILLLLTVLSWLSAQLHWWAFLWPLLHEHF